MRIGGSFYLKIDNKLLNPVEGEFSCSLGGMKREAALSSFGVAGFTEKSQVPFIDGEIFLIPDFDLQKLFATTDATCIVTLNNQKTFILSHAWYAGDCEFNTAGKTKIRFEGMKGEYVDA